LSGTVGGFVFGGLGGFAGGVLAAKMMGTPLVQGEKINGYLYGAVGFLIGGTYGVIYGLTHGRQDDYLFPASVRPQR
ncbi:MAG TPA: hypothetical protein VK470_11160, partial [Bacteroidota bacterium]|nr:hypothetical protein [Bacteroidota bacterium]